LIQPASVTGSEDKKIEPGNFLIDTRSKNQNKNILMLLFHFLIEFVFGGQGSGISRREVRPGSGL
jgi:hypothetical protein